jgi:hypothetical protein
MFEPGHTAGADLPKCRVLLPPLPHLAGGNRGDFPLVPEAARAREHRALANLPAVGLITLSWRERQPANRGCRQR